MTSLVRAEAHIDAPAPVVYGIFIDYRDAHPRVLPRPYFESLEVLAGGTGAGTRMRIVMRILGRRYTMEHVASEPEPGRVLVETDTAGLSATRFTVTPGERAGTCHVELATSFRTRQSGVLGAMEARMTSWMLRRIYQRELALVRDLALARAAQRSS